MTKVNSPEDSDIVIQKIPCDMGIHRNPRKGTLNGPEKIMEGLDLKERFLVDEVFPEEFDLEETHRRIEKNTEELLQYDRPLISVGGDHSVSFPVIKALKEENPDLKLVWLDAHLDLKEKVDGHVSHDVVVRELLDHGFSEDEIVFLGITEVDYDEEEFLESHDFAIYRPDEVDDFLEQELDGDYYLSVDIDVLRPEIAPGTGYRDGEMELEEVLEVIERLGPVHADLVEVAPPFDENGRTIEAARNILEKLADSAVKR
ncbi:arginase family protein [Candidatus Nanohalovita haloferacivicina]|uniref:arginase family protein n=1 Tax=Candidatus Nanohalovita haloferacivicina TaxID=2978046 RepID=UPI00325F99BB|nr:Agmatinase [Candidatus Nanohalobia archaeon BNXNv]